MRAAACLALSALGSLLFAGAAAAQSSDGSFANPAHFQERDGASLYRFICQSCHMANGKGAVGAGAYPALAGNQNLAVAGYPVLVVLNGHHGMPGLAGMLDDGQVAAVVNYVRSHFGNTYSDNVSIDDVRTARTGK